MIYIDTNEKLASIKANLIYANNNLKKIFELNIRISEEISIHSYLERLALYSDNAILEEKLNEKIEKLYCDTLNLLNGSKSALDIIKIVRSNLNDVTVNSKIINSDDIKKIYRYINIFDLSKFILTYNYQILTLKLNSLKSYLRDAYTYYPNKTKDFLFSANYLLMLCSNYDLNSKTYNVNKASYNLYKEIDEIIYLINKVDSKYQELDTLYKKLDNSFLY